MKASTVPDETILTVLRLATKAGIELCYRGGHIPPEAALEGLRDPEWLVADCYGMTKAEYAAWETHDWQCRATTKAGARCRNFVAGANDSGGDFPPDGFDPKAARFRYCKVHQGMYWPAVG